MYTGRGYYGNPRYDGAGFAKPHHRVAMSTPTEEGKALPEEGSGFALDFESDTPLICNRDQTGDTTCESCQ